MNPVYPDELSLVEFVEREALDVPAAFTRHWIELVLRRAGGGSNVSPPGLAPFDERGVAPGVGPKGNRPARSPRRPRSHPGRGGGGGRDGRHHRRQGPSCSPTARARPNGPASASRARRRNHPRSARARPISAAGTSVLTLGALLYGSLGRPRGPRPCLASSVNSVNLTRRSWAIGPQQGASVASCPRLWPPCSQAAPPVQRAASPRRDRR